MNVLVWAREKSLERRACRRWATAPSKEAFFEQCDVISLHMRLVDATRHIVTRARSRAHEADRDAGQHHRARR